MSMKKLPAEQVAALEKAFRNARNPTEKMRYQAILLAVKGFKRAEICRIVEKSPRSIGGWVWIYNTKGLQGLRNKPHKGNHRLLTDKQKAKIKSLITNKTPEELALKGRFWTIPLLEQLAFRELHVRYKDQDSYRRLLHWCGFSFHKPNKVNKRQSPHMKKRFEDKLKKDSGGIKTTIAWYW